jgi:hypothetical protein
MFCQASFFPLTLSPKREREREKKNELPQSWARWRGEKKKGGLGGFNFFFFFPLKEEKRKKGRKPLPHTFLSHAPGIDADTLETIDK